MGVKAIDEDGNADASLLMDHDLHVTIHRLALGIVGLGTGCEKKLVELLVLPGGFIPGRLGGEEQV